MHVSFFFFFYGYGYHRDLHVLTHSFPTRRSSDLQLDLRFDKRAKRSRREIVDAEGDRRRVRGAGLAAGPDRDDHRVREGRERPAMAGVDRVEIDRKSTRLNSSH